MNMRKISKNLLIMMFLIVFIFSLPMAVMAEDMTDMPGMDGGQSDQAPVEPGSPGYKPIEQPADDSTMAIIAAAVFGLPVLGWLVVRSAKKGKKKSK